jgi:hypothetical protein
MSLFGCFIVARSEHPLWDLPVLRRFCAEAVDPDIAPAQVVGHRADGTWQQVQTFDGNGFDIADLVLETGSPVMFIYVVESEFGGIEAQTPGGDRWWGYLNPDAAVGDYGAPEPPEPLTAIANRAVAWAAHTGRTANAEAVVQALQQRPGPFGEGVDALLEALDFRFGPQLPVDRP